MTPTVRVHVGCSTPRPSPGIHVFDLVDDDGTPRLDPGATVTDVAHPSFLAAHPNADVLYAVSETEDGSIVAFGADRDGALTELQRVSSAGDGPCHVSTDGEHVHVANYGSGSAASYALRPDGSIGDRVWAVQHRGSGPHRRQDAPHAHCAVPDPRRPSIHVVDLGTDRVVRYDADVDAGGFRPAAELVVAAGSGPRHLAFHPHDPTAFVVCELDNTLVALDVEPGSGDLVVRQTVSTLPDDATGQSLAAAVKIHPDGDRVYVSNRGHDSIVVFGYHRDDAPLTLLGHVDSGGEGPRDIVLDPSGTLLLAANQHSGDITGFAVEPSGLPRPLGVLARLPQPTCVVVTGGAS